MMRVISLFIYLIVCSSVLGSAEEFPTSRDKFKWPFASNSIWNLPIGANAVYVPAGFQVPKTPGLYPDRDVIVLTPDAPLLPIYQSGSAGWGVRCYPDNGDKVLYNAPLPDGFFLPSSLDNYCTAILLPDNNTIVQTQPLCRCNASTPYTARNTVTFDVLDGLGTWGSHGGSGLSSIGGTVRLGELLPGAKMRHALKMNLNANRYCYRTPCFRYPASNCDSYYATVYNGTVEAVQPGALLALPASLNISLLNLETEVAASLAWTLQNYGAYVADDTYFFDVFAMEVEISPSGSVTDEFKQTYGMDFFSHNNSWARDLNKIYVQLAVVDNNNYETIIAAQQSNGALGTGGGAPRQPWAPALAGTKYTPVPLAINMVAQNGTLAAGWKLTSLGNITNATNVQYLGSGSIKLVTKDNYQSYVFQAAGKGFNTTGYSYLHLALKTGQPEPLCTSISAYAGSWTGAVPSVSLMRYGQGYANPRNWTIYNVPLDRMNASNSAIQTIIVVDCSGAGANKTFYIDQVQFTTVPYVNSSSPLPSTSTGTSAIASSTTSGVTSGATQTQGSSTTVQGSSSTITTTITTTSSSTTAQQSPSTSMGSSTTGQEQGHAAVTTPAMWILFGALLCFYLL